MAPGDGLRTKTRGSGASDAVFLPGMTVLFDGWGGAGRERAGGRRRTRPAPPFRLSNPFMPGKKPPSDAPPHRIFVPSPSPGAVVRRLQRAARQTIDAGSWPTTCLVSHPSRSGWRLLTSDDVDFDAALERLARILAESFPPHVRVARRGEETGDWGFLTIDAAGTVGPWDVPSPAPSKGWLARLAVIKTPDPATALGLPAGTLAPSLSRLPILDYETIAALDRKSLLVEDTPRLYRFELGENDTISS